MVHQDVAGTQIVSQVVVVVVVVVVGRGDSFGPGWFDDRFSRYHTQILHL